MGPTQTKATTGKNVPVSKNKVGSLSTHPFAAKLSSSTYISAPFVFSDCSTPGSVARPRREAMDNRGAQQTA